MNDERTHASPPDDLDCPARRTPVDARPRFRICVATPLYGTPASAKVGIQYAGTLFALAPQLDVLCGGEGWRKGDIHLEPYAHMPCNVVHARSDLVKRFLEHPADYTHLLFWDEDVVGSPKQVATLLSKMLKAGKPIVGVPYVHKTIHWEQAAQAALEWVETCKLTGKRIDSWSAADPNDPTIRELAHLLQGFAVRYVPDWTAGDWHAHGPVDEHGLVEMQRAMPIGFSLLRRDMLRSMVSHYSELRYSKGRGSVTGLFMMTLRDGSLVDEDYAFCKRWRDMGGRLHLYLGPEAPLGHLGAHIYRGTHEGLVADWNGRGRGDPNDVR